MKENARKKRQAVRGMGLSTKDSIWKTECLSPGKESEESEERQ